MFDMPLKVKWRLCTQGSKYSVDKEKISSFSEIDVTPNCLFSKTFELISRSREHSAEAI